MTTKGPPTRHSHYVTGALAPLKAALDSEHVRRLPSSETERIKSTVADIVNVRCGWIVVLKHVEGLGPISVVRRGIYQLLGFFDDLF
jgi:hypothetical protein